MTETILATLDLNLAVALLVAIAAGMAHGFTGFGGALVAMPLYAVLFGPVEALAILVFAGVVGSAQLTVRAARIVRWPHVIPMMVAAIIFTPLGVFSLVTVDPDLIRRAIGLLVLAGALVIGFGWTYKGPRNTASGAVAGALAGYLTGSTGMGGPPLAAYMLAFPDPADVQRANIVVMTALLITVTLVGLIFGQFSSRDHRADGIAHAGLYVRCLVGRAAFPQPVPDPVSPRGHRAAGRRRNHCINRLSTAV